MVDGRFRESRIPLIHPAPRRVPAQTDAQSGKGSVGGSAGGGASRGRPAAVDQPGERAKSLGEQPIRRVNAVLNALADP
jgi:hypothetical protein